MFRFRAQGLGVGSFPKLGVPFLGVPIMRIVLGGGSIVGSADLGKPIYRCNYTMYTYIYLERQRERKKERGYTGAYWDVYGHGLWVAN